MVNLVDVSCFGGPTRLRWHKLRWECPDPGCPAGNWTEEDDRIASPRPAMTDGAVRWIIEPMRRSARSVNEVTKELGYDWHTVNDGVVVYGEALVDHPGRLGDMDALGLDKVLFWREWPFHRRHFSASIVRMSKGPLLDDVRGRSGAGPRSWLTERGPQRLGKVPLATLDLSGPYRAVFDAVVPDAVQGERDPKVVAQVAMSRLRAKIPELQEAFSGRFDDHHALACRQVTEHIDFVDRSIAILIADATERLCPFEPAVTILCSIPGVSKTTAEVLISETGADMTPLPTSGSLCAWAGVAPASHESAGKRSLAGTRSGSTWL
jgi:hypothetical protein